VKGLQAGSDLRPDLRFLCMPRSEACVSKCQLRSCTLADICSRTLQWFTRAPTVGHGLRTRLPQPSMEAEKRKKYAAIARRHDAELIPFVVETCGVLGQDAIALLDVISDAASEHLSIWSQEAAAKEVLHSVAIAVQKGNAMTVLGTQAAAHLRAA
jgi:hypothetical protein